MTIQENTSLKHLNTFGIDAKARYFAEIDTVEKFRSLLEQEKFRKMAKFILGDGSNILLTKDYDGLVIKNALKGIETVSENENHIWLKVGAGENWHDFVMHCIKKNYGGVENLSLIPGTVGAAPIQNIGAYGMELSETFLQLEALNLQDSQLKIFTHDACEFAYRDSVFKNLHKDHYAILSVTFQLNKKHQFKLDYGTIQETLERMQIKELNLKVISDAIIQIRRSKLPDPKELGNAGSFFKNPIITESHFTELQEKFPKIPSFATDNPNAIKVPAAWLIEQCGFKGKRFGDIGIYEKQALILVNYGNGTGSAIYELAKKIQQAVHEQFAILLTPEVNLI